MRRTLPDFLIVASVAGLGLGLAAAGLGLWFDRNMGSNLLAELFGVLLEIFLVVVAIDWLLKRKRRKDWDFAGAEISKRLAVVFIDLMRLLNTSSDSSAQSPDSRRWSQFIDMAEHHHLDLKSNIEAFAVAFDPPLHQACRRVEAKLGWMLGRVRRGDHVYSGVDNLETMKEIGDDLDTFLRSVRGEEYQGSRSSVAKIVEKRAIVDPARQGSVTSTRYGAQTEILKDTALNPEGIRSVIDDGNLTLAIPYFILDHLLLVAASTK
jgi:hypothetical protein